MAELQPLLAQLPDNPNEYLHAAMRDGTAKSNDGKGIALQVDVEAAVMRKLRAAMFAGADTELTTAEQTRLPVLISAGDCAEHRDRFVSDSDGYSPDKLVYGYAAFVYLAGGEDSTLFFRHDSGKVESVACTPGRMVVFKNLAVRHWVEGPMEQARVMLGPFAAEPREGEIRQITAGLTYTPVLGWFIFAIVCFVCSVVAIVIACSIWAVVTIFDSADANVVPCAEDFNIWAFSMAFEIFVIGMPSIACVICTSPCVTPWCELHEYDDIRVVVLAFISSCVTLVLAVRGVLLWSNMTSECHQYYEANYPNLLLLFKVSVAISVIFGVISFVWFALVTCVVAPKLRQLVSGTGAGYSDIPDSLDRDASEGTAEQTEDYVSHRS